MTQSRVHKLLYDKELYHNILIQKGGNLRHPTEVNIYQSNSKMSKKLKKISEDFKTPGESSASSNRIIVEQMIIIAILRQLTSTAGYKAYHGFLVLDDFSKKINSTINFFHRITQSQRETQSTMCLFF